MTRFAKTAILPLGCGDRSRLFLRYIKRLRAVCNLRAATPLIPHACARNARVLTLRAHLPLPTRALRFPACAAVEWLRRGGNAVRQAHMLRRPPAVVVSNTNGFLNPVPVWE